MGWCWRSVCLLWMHGVLDSVCSTEKTMPRCESVKNKAEENALVCETVILSSQRVADKHTEYHPLQLKDIISLESALIWPLYFDKTPWPKTTWIGEGYTTRSQSIIDQGQNRNSSKNHGGILLLASSRDHLLASCSALFLRQSRITSWEMVLLRVGWAFPH